MSERNLFESIEPHRYLPEKTRNAMWAACQLVVAHADDFVEAAKWLHGVYSPEVLRNKCELTYRRDFAQRFGLLRLNGTGNFATSTHERRLRLQEAWSCNNAIKRRSVVESVLLDLQNETIQEARFRGYRLEGVLILPTAGSYSLTYADNSMPSSRTAMVRWKLVGRPFPRLVGPPIDEDNVEIVWRCEDKQFSRRYKQLKAERRRRTIAEHDHPDDVAWRLEQAIEDVKAAGLPAGRKEERNARRVVLVATLIAHPRPIPSVLKGAFCEWGWEDIGDWGRRIWDEWHGNHFQPYVGGRNTVLFGLPYQRDIQSYERWNEFADLVARAVNILLAAVPHSAGDVAAVAPAPPINLSENAIKPIEVGVPLTSTDIQSPASTTASQLPVPEVSHTKAFESVVWYGRVLTFSGTQAKAVQCLWEAYEKRPTGSTEGLSIRQGNIGATIGSNANCFRLLYVFRDRNNKMHEAWGTMIHPDGPGKFRLAPPPLVSQAVSQEKLENHDSSHASSHRTRTKSTRQFGRGKSKARKSSSGS